MVARGFARHMAGLDEHTEIPPLGLVPMRQRWRPPFLFSTTDIDVLMDAAGRRRWRLPSATYTTLIGLLATTGMRVGEALRLEPDDINHTDAVIVIQAIEVRQVTTRARSSPTRSPRSTTTSPTATGCCVSSGPRPGCSCRVVVAR